MSEAHKGNIMFLYLREALRSALEGDNGKRGGFTM